MFSKLIELQYKERQLVEGIKDESVDLWGQIKSNKYLDSKIPTESLNMIEELK